MVLDSTVYPHHWIPLCHWINLQVQSRKFYHQWSQYDFVFFLKYRSFVVFFYLFLDAFVYISSINFFILHSLVITRHVVVMRPMFGPKTEPGSRNTITPCDIFSLKFQKYPATHLRETLRTLIVVLKQYYYTTVFKKQYFISLKIFWVFYSYLFLTNHIGNLSTSCQPFPQ